MLVSPESTGFERQEELTGCFPEGSFAPGRCKSNRRYRSFKVPLYVSADIFRTAAVHRRSSDRQTFQYSFQLTLSSLAKLHEVSRFVRFNDRAHPHPEIAPAIRIGFTPPKTVSVLLQRFQIGFPFDHLDVVVVIDGLVRFTSACASASSNDFTGKSDNRPSDHLMPTGVDESGLNPAPVETGILFELDTFTGDMNRGDTINRGGVFHRLQNTCDFSMTIGTANLISSFELYLSFASRFSVLDSVNG